MKKKERRKIKTFARSEEWQNLPKDDKVKFAKVAMLSEHYDNKDKKEILKIISTK